MYEGKRKNRKWSIEEKNQHAKFYGVTLDYLVSENREETIKSKNEQH